MTDYHRWTKDDLINRVKELETALKTQHQSADQQSASANAESTATQPQDGDNHTTSLPGRFAKKPQKKPKSMDPSKWSTRFIALKLAYLGKNYNGFEYQSSGLMSTIEEELWKALVKACLIFPDPERPNEIDWNVCEYSKCGRTDRGVSAFGQVVALRVRSNKPARRKGAQQAAAPVPGGAEETMATEKASQVDEDVDKTEGAEAAPEDDDNTPVPVEQEIQYARVLNRILPPDIKVYAWCPNPPPEFSARFSCRERQYRYFFTQPAFAPLPNFLESTNSANDTNGKTSSPTQKPKDGWLDIDAMRQAAKMFEGLHDFRNFCKVDASKQITNFVRRIFEADIVEVDGVDSSIPYLTGPQFRDPNIVSDTAVGDQRYPKVYYFHVRGSAFLWHQIRCMVAILFLVGQGLESPRLIAELLDVARNPRRPNYVLADDAPLVLWDCIFGRRELDAEEAAEGAEGAADELDWVYVGSDGDCPTNLHGGAGVAGDLWSYWRGKKMDEILANRLVDWVAHKTEIHRVPGEAQTSANAAKYKATKSTRVFEGGNGPKFAGAYVPVLKKELIQSPEELNDRWAQRKGFNNAEEMRAKGNWREVIRAAKESGTNTEEK